VGQETKRVSRILGLRDEAPQGASEQRTRLRLAAGRPFMRLVMGWGAFLLAHALATVIAGTMVKHETPVADVLEILITLDAIFILGSLSLVVSGTWGLAKRIHSKPLRISTLVAGLAAQICVGTFLFIHIGVLLFVFSSGWRLQW